MIQRNVCQDIPFAADGRRRRSNDLLPDCDARKRRLLMIDCFLIIISTVNHRLQLVRPTCCFFRRDGSRGGAASATVGNGQRRDGRSGRWRRRRRTCRLLQIGTSRCLIQFPVIIQSFSDRIDDQILL